MAILASYMWNCNLMEIHHLSDICDSDCQVLRCLSSDECFGVLATLLPLVELADLSKTPSLLVSDALGSTSYV